MSVRARGLGIEPRCLGEDLVMDESGMRHVAACHMVELDEPPSPPKP